MLYYVVKRILFLIPVIIIVSFIVFALMDLAPGTLIDNLMYETMTAEDVAALRAQYDLDKPMIYRYGKYMFRLVQGDLGVADVGGISVWELYISRLPNTLYLAFAAFGIGSAISIPMGIRAARNAGRLSDTLTTTFTLVGISMPGFWLGFLLLLLFSYRLGWLPAGGMSHGVRSFILPALCSGLMMMSSSTRQTRSSMLEVLNSDYLRTARSKGVPEQAVIRRHALGNAWIPILTTMGGALSVALAGSAVVESVFAWPGVGRATVEAVRSRDVTATCGLVIMTTILYVIIQLCVDIMYAFVDPRIRSQYTSSKRRRKRLTSAAPVDTGLLPGLSAAEAAVPALDDLAEVRLSAAEAVPDADTVEPVSGYMETAGVQSKEVLIEQIGRTVPVPAEADNEALVTRHSSVVRDEIKEVGTDEDVAALIRKYRKRSRFGEIWHSIKRNKSAMAGLFIIIFILLVLIGSLFISYEAITAPDVRNSLAPPSWQHLFGTDDIGRDVFLRTIYGSRYSLVIGIGTVAMGTIIGMVLGSLAGYYGGKTDEIIMRASDTLASIPGMLLGMVIVTVLGQSLRNLIIAVGVTSIPVFIRISRASVLTIRNQEFVEAARAIGISTSRIIFTQVLPNGLAPIIVTITGSIGISIIVAASLSFLGFGVPVPHPEWGALVSAGRVYLRVASNLITFPGLFIMVTVLGFNLLGDGLRDALDPKMKR